MSITVRTDFELNVIECADCGLPFGVTINFEKRRREDHGTFYCPRGHSNYYPQESDKEKYKRLLGEEQSKHANTQLELMMKQKEIKRLQKRAKNGICPCCHRQFTQLTRHMNSKHPDFAK